MVISTIGGDAFYLCRVPLALFSASLIQAQLHGTLSTVPAVTDTPWPRGFWCLPIYSELSLPLFPGPSGISSTAASAEKPSPDFKMSERNCSFQQLHLTPPLYLLTAFWDVILICKFICVLSASLYQEAKCKKWGFLSCSLLCSQLPQQCLANLLGG